MCVGVSVHGGSGKAGWWVVAGTQVGWVGRGGLIVWFVAMPGFTFPSCRH